jgi:hypothetical protein
VSTPINDGGNAFPHAQRLWDNDAQSWAVHSVGGMTLRDYLAAQALAGMVSRAPVGAEFSFSDYAVQAYFFADAMLAAREVKQ